MIYVQFSDREKEREIKKQKEITNMTLNFVLAFYDKIMPKKERKRQKRRKIYILRI